MITKCKCLFNQITIIAIIVLFLGSIIYGQTAIVSGGNFGMGTYNYAGTTNVAPEQTDSI
jgi:hypothetical protein